MNPRQTEMARHALGLTDGRKRSYRNHYTVNNASPDFQHWKDMVAGGFAEAAIKSDFSGFCLTQKGAEAVLQFGESLDTEDFPERAP